MAKIRCKEYDCKHNYCEECMKCSIEVTKDARCDSFDTKRDGSPIEMEFGLEEEFLSNHSDKEILCKCDTCISNKNSMCTRTHLQVGTLNNVAKCESYQKRF